MGILVGDTNVHKHYVAITNYVLQVLLEAGFILREEVVKIQYKMEATMGKWLRRRKRDFFLIYHGEAIHTEKTNGWRRIRGVQVR